MPRKRASESVQEGSYPLHDFDLRATHARTLLPAALASVSFGFVLVRVRSHDVDARIKKASEAFGARLSTLENRSCGHLIATLE